MLLNRLPIKAALFPVLVIATLTVFAGHACGTDRGTFDLKEYFVWQIVICHHPMYMLVDEDRGALVLPSAKKGRFRDWEIFNLPAKEMF